MRRTIPILLTVAFFATIPTAAHAGGSPMSGFIKASKAAVGKQRFVAGLRVPRLLRKVLPRLGVTRRVVQVTNATLGQYTAATKKGYLEVVVPANKGHVYFRYGNEVFDFFPGGFRIGGVRPIRSERYGALVKLTPEQESRLQTYLARLKSNEGRELGTYDFKGEKGFHCVSWMMRLAFDDKGSDLIKTLGGKKSGMGMVGFSRFMLKQARGVEAVVVYQDQARTPSQLDRVGFSLMTSRALRRANIEETTSGQ